MRPDGYIIEHRYPKIGRAWSIVPVHVAEPVHATLRDAKEVLAALRQEALPTNVEFRIRAVIGMDRITEHLARATA